MIHFHQWSPWEDWEQVLVHRGIQAKFPTRITIYQVRQCRVCGKKTYREDVVP